VHLTIIESKIIGPDSSHWAKWLDAMSARDANQREGARSLHRRLLDQGRIPLLTWHHLEELLGHEDGARAKARVTHLQALPLVAYLRLDKDKIGLGSIVQVLAAETIAASEGHRDLISIRDRARELLLKTGSGTQAVGVESWLWEVIRPELQSRSDKMDTIAALRHLRTFDEKQTISELLKAEITLRRRGTRGSNESTRKRCTRRCTAPAEMPYGRVPCPTISWRESSQPCRLRT
jgi:hypothetical protein